MYLMNYLKVLCLIITKAKSSVFLVCTDYCVICSAESCCPPLWLSVWQAQQGVHAVPLGRERPQKVSRRREEGQWVCTQLLQVTLGFLLLLWSYGHIKWGKKISLGSNIMFYDYLRCHNFRLKIDPHVTALNKIVEKGNGCNRIPVCYANNMCCAKFQDLLLYFYITPCLA